MAMIALDLNGSTRGYAGSEGPSRRLANRLSAELSAPVGIIQPSRRVYRVHVGAPVDGFPPVEAAADAATPGAVAIWRPGEPGEPCWLLIPLPGVSGVAIAGFASEPGPTVGPWGPHVPEPALRAWGQAIADRLMIEETPSTEVPAFVAPRVDGRVSSLSERLIRRLRISDPPERFQRLAVVAAREALGVEVVAWVPGQAREAIVVDGGLTGMGPEGYRALLPEADGEVICVDNAPESPPGVPLNRLLVVAAAAQGDDPPAGWLVAANPVDDRRFAHQDVELLQPVAALLGTQRNNARLYADLKDLLFGVVRALTAAIDAKDPYTSGHSERVARIAVRLGEALGMSGNQRGDLYLMGLLHDVGKIGIDDLVLKKPGKLTSDEYRQIQSHVKIGVRILTDLKKLSHLLPGVAHHHESLDGTGYPDGLAGEAIPLPARILAVADAFDAMSSTRPYRKRLSPGQIDETFRKGAGVQWDPRVVDALFASRADLERIRQKGLGESLHQVVSETLGRK